LDEISRENASDYINSPLPLAWCAANLSRGESDEKQSDKKQGLINALKPLAKEYKGQLLFVLLNVDTFGGQAENLGIPKYPGLMIQKAADKYLYEGDLNDTRGLSEFVSAWKNGKLTPYRKSQAPPEAQHDGHPFILVGKTFEAHVGTKEKDAFVDFYAEWCPPCKRMAPTFIELAKTFQNVSGLMIAKIEADKNDTFQKIPSYPTLLFFKKGSREGIKYEGDRSLSSFIEFVKANATVDCSSVSVPTTS